MPDFPERSTSTPPYPNGNLEELQELLLAAERGRLDRLEDRLRNSVVDASAEQKRLDQLEGDLKQLDDHLKNKVIDATSVAKVLPDAIRQRGETLEPVFGTILGDGIRRKPTFFADALFPVIGPAIRKAIATALQDMVQSMNRTLDHSLSWRGLTWRWEAWRTGKSFGEIVLAHTLKYQVDRVVLFFKKDGVHLADVHRPDLPPFEGLASSMFSAIQTAVQKFAQDEFQASDEASWKTVELDDRKENLTVWIEQGSKAVLAAVVRGLPPPSLRDNFKAELESIHFELYEALQKFRGDKKPFEAARPYLEACLLQKENDFSSETGSSGFSLSPALIIVLMVLLTSLGWWGITNYLDQQQEDEEQLRWAHFLEKARGKPGIQITHTQTADGKNGKTIVYGLRDRLSDEPQKIAQEVGLSAEAIDFRLEPYLSLAPELLKRRTRERLDQLVQEIEAHHFDFEAGSSSLAAGFGVALQRVLQKLREGDTLAQQLGERLRVEIHGNTTEEGPVELNQRLAHARAQEVLSVLNAEQFPATDFVSVPESVGHSTSAGLQSSKPLRTRQVSFHVTVNDSELRGSMP